MPWKGRAQRLHLDQGLERQWPQAVARAAQGEGATGGRLQKNAAASEAITRVHSGDGTQEQWAEQDVAGHAENGEVGVGRRQGEM